MVPSTPGGPWIPHGEIIIGCQGNDVVLDTVTSLAVNDDVHIGVRVELQQLAGTHIRCYIQHCNETPKLNLIKKTAFLYYSYEMVKPACVQIDLVRVRK